MRRLAGTDVPVGQQHARRAGDAGQLKGEPLLGSASACMTGAAAAAVAETSDRRGHSIAWPFFVDAALSAFAYNPTSAAADVGRDGSA